MKISGRMVGIGVTATLVASTPFVIAYAAGAATESLLSQGRTATSSSVETSSLGPANAVDGKTSTRWASKEGSDPQWIRVDLGASHPISHVKLVWEAAYGKAYQVQTSADGTTWKSIYSTSTGNGATDDLTGLSGSGRFVRVLGTKRGTPYGYSLYEFQVFGSEGGGTLGDALGLALSFLVGTVLAVLTYAAGTACARLVVREPSRSQPEPA